MVYGDEDEGSFPAGFFCECVQKVKLRNPSGQYLVASTKDSVSLDPDGFSCNSDWIAKPFPNSRNFIRFINCCTSKYLTASVHTGLFGWSKVVQTLPPTDSIDHERSINWQPIKATHSNLVMLKADNNTFLRTCSLRPNTVNLAKWNNNETGILWRVEISEMKVPEELHKAALKFYNTLASPVVVERAVSFFESMDTDKNGKVSIDEFLNFFNQFGNQMGMDRNFFAAFDKNGDGSLLFDEVITLHYIMITRVQAIHIQQFEEILKARIQNDAPQNETEKKQNQAFLDFMAVAQTVSSVSSLALGCCSIM